MARRVEDAGRKIGGARKDRVPGTQAAAASPKEAAWPVDYPALVEAGMPAAVAALVKVVRDRMAAKPDPRLLEPGTRDLRDPALLARDYARMAGIARDVLEACRTEDDVAAAEGRIRAAAGWHPGTRPDASMRVMFATVFKGNSSPFTVRGEERARAAALLAEGFPGAIPAWRRGLTVRRDGDGTHSAWKAGRRVADGEPTREAALEAAREALTRKDPDAKIEPDRPHLDHLERSGLPDHRGGREVESGDFVDVLGYSAVEFGNWVPHVERGPMVDMAWDAVHDLAAVVGVPPSAFSLGGELSVAFGSRGGGRYAAHYESDTLATNMTRLTGAGKLAHEIGHALDNAAGGVEHMGQEDPKLVRSGSGWHGWRTGSSDDTAHLGAEATAAWDALMFLLRRRPVTKAEKVAELERALADGGVRLEGQRKRLAGLRAPEPGRRADVRFARDLQRWCEAEETRLRGVEGRLREVRDAPEGGDFGSVQTEYMNQAMRLANGKRDGYHVRPTEMFARAFECYVFDALREAGARCDYLVHGVEEDRFAGEEYKGNPYPTGDERRAINMAMGRMLRAMAPYLESFAKPDAAPAP